MKTADLNIFLPRKTNSDFSGRGGKFPCYHFTDCWGTNTHCSSDADFESKDCIDFMKRLLIAAACLALWLIGPSGQAASAQDWKPVEPALLAETKPVVQPDADAETIFSDIDIFDGFRQRDAETTIRHYVRMKIYTERGKRFGSVTIRFYDYGRVGDVAGRTIKPDGTVVELGKEAIFERDAYRSGRYRMKEKTFALPAVEPGCVIEYRWSEYHRTFRQSRYPIQAETPIRNLTFRIKPLTTPDNVNNIYMYADNLRLKVFNGAMPPFKEETPGIRVGRFQNLPAFAEEVYAPPTDNLRQWLLLYYEEEISDKAEKYWRNRGKHMFETYRPLLAGDDSLRVAATKAIGDAATGDQQLDRLFLFCRSAVRNLQDRTATISAEERLANRPTQTPAETLKRGVGTPDQITRLFVALAEAAGFPAFVAKVSDRTEFVLDPATTPIDALLDDDIAAVRLGTVWRFLEPGDPFTTPTLPVWWHQGIPALILDPKDPVFVVTPMSKPGQSKTRRIGTFTLDQAGTLTGEVRLELSGHAAREWRAKLNALSPSMREDRVREYIQERLPAITSDIRIDNLDNPSKLIVMVCKIQATGYAVRTGKRLALPVSVFERRQPVRFPDERRVQPISFDYPWVEDDTVSFVLPEGFELDNPESPATFTVPGDYGQYATKVTFSATDRKLSYRRVFAFGREGALMEFAPSLYPTIKTIFDEVRKQDEHVIILKTP